MCISPRGGSYNTLKSVKFNLKEIVKRFIKYSQPQLVQKRFTIVMYAFSILKDERLAVLTI